MTKLVVHRTLLLIAALGVACAQGSIGGPVAGYVTDSSRTQLRTIFGVPGAFGFSEPLTLPDGVSQIRLAPWQEFALVERAGSAPAILFLKEGAVGRLVPVEAAMPSADWIAFSPAANSALLFSNATSRLQVISGLPNSPRLVADLDSATLPETPALGAVSDDGSLVLVASAAAVYHVLPSGAAQVLLSARRIRSIVVLRNGVDAAVSDLITGSVQILRNAASHPEAAVLASGIEGVGALYPSSDGQLLYAQAQAGIASIDVASGEIKSFPTSVVPSGLTPLRNRDTFLISARTNQPGWIFYRDEAGGRTVFIPAAGTRERPVKGAVR